MDTYHVVIKSKYGVESHIYAVPFEQVEGLHTGVKSHLTTTELYLDSNWYSFVNTHVLSIVAYKESK